MRESPACSSSLPYAGVYDDRYATTDYRQSISGCEVARAAALRHFLTRVVRVRSGARVLDYGAGAGLHVELWESSLPDAELHFCDISHAAQQRFAERYPKHAERYRLMRDGVAEFPDEGFDLVVSVEVMEHVGDLDGYLKDIHRVLRPGGCFVWTTPCANIGSIEQVFTALSRQVVQTDEGYRVWRWEDPTHLRRLRTAEVTDRLRRVGFQRVEFRWRSHLFSFVGTYCPPRSLFPGLRERLMTFDYRWFRRLPNGASMIGAAYKSS